MLSAIGKFLLDYVFSALFTFASNLLDKILRRKKIEEDAEKSVEDLKKAKTKEEISDATRGTLDGM